MKIRKKERMKIRKKERKKERKKKRKKKRKKEKVGQFQQYKLSKYELYSASRLYQFSSYIPYARRLWYTRTGLAQDQRSEVQSLWALLYFKSFVHFLMSLPDGP